MSAVVLPKLVEPSVIFRKLHVSRTTLKRWVARGYIHAHRIGPKLKFIASEVEEDLQKLHFGPEIPQNLIGTQELRERVPPATIIDRFGLSRDTLQRRIDEGVIPHYRLGGTYRFAPDELICRFSLGPRPSKVDQVEPEVGGLL